MTEAETALIIAEDEPLARMALRAQVEALGFTVLAVARDGAEAAALLRCVPAELAIFDMKMPVLSGLDAAARAFPEALAPVLLLTGFGAADLPDPVPRPPIFAVVTKPVGLAELGKGVDQARARFADWVAAEGREADVRKALERRRLIARALESDDEGADAAAALRFLRRAAAEGIDPAELARRTAGPEDDSGSPPGR